MRIAFLLIIASSALGACSSDKPPPQAQTQAPQPPGKTVFDTQLKALDKAKAVQGVVDKQNRDADKKLEDAGG
ncbi:MAG: hypothetical protein P4L92_06215 [Rudaea sp.]|nr:hypothetical protein [Rudaea sp.]